MDINRFWLPGKPLNAHRAKDTDPHVVELIVPDALLSAILVARKFVSMAIAANDSVTLFAIGTTTFRELAPVGPVTVPRFDGDVVKHLHRFVRGVDACHADPVEEAFMVLEDDELVCSERVHVNGTQFWMTYMWRDTQYITAKTDISMLTQGPIVRAA